MMVVLGFDGEDYICHDPAGRWSEEFKYGGYSGADRTEGQGIRYSKEAFEYALAYDGNAWIHDIQ